MIELRRTLNVSVVALLFVATGALAQPASLESRELLVDEISRSYELFVPPAPAGDLPLLVVLHGRGGSGQGMASATGFNELAAGIVAYPHGLEEQWNYLTGIGGNDGVDDVHFLHRLVDEISSAQPVDSERVYVAGFSNGGFMAQRLACEPDSPFDAFASVAGAGFGGLPALCDQQRPISMMLVHGTADEVVPWSGQVGVFGEREVLLSASTPQTLGFWASFAGCGGASDRRSIALPGPVPESVEVLRVTDCPDGAEVILYAIVGGGHAWPRLEVATGSAGGFDVSRVILEFFGIEANEE